MRLTVVTIFGLIGTVTTGFLGMNLLAEADAPMGRKLWIFAIVFVLTLVLTFYTMAKSSACRTFWTCCPTSAPRPGKNLQRSGWCGGKTGTERLDMEAISSQNNLSRISGVRCQLLKGIQTASRRFAVTQPAAKRPF